MKKVIQIGGVNPLSLLGANDCNLKILEKYFSGKLIVRGSEMILEGKKAEINYLQSAVDDMIITINNKGFVDEQDVKSLLDYSEIETNRNVVYNDKATVILHTHKGTVVARTVGQKKYYEAVKSNDIVFAIGPAGTGKTYQAVASAVAAMKDGTVSRIVITRPAVEAGERLGFLPGDLKEKVDPYLTPLNDALVEMIPHEKLKNYREQRIIEIAPLAYMRGRTLHNSFMILDEAQNATTIQMKMFLTRLGVTSRAIVTGDITQIDLQEKEISGLVDAREKLQAVKGITFVEFDSNDVVRHRLVKDIIKAYAN